MSEMSGSGGDPLVESELGASAATDALDVPAPSGQPKAAAPGHGRSLWRHAEFMKLWTAATISLMGSQVSQLAIPFIAAVVLRASPLEVAMLGAVEMTPFILLTLPAGAWLDRVRRRPVLIAGDFGRGLALLTIPIAYAAGFLTIWQLYAVGFVAGSLTVLFDVADQSYLPALLSSDELVEGNSKLSISQASAQVIGPAFAGGLIGIIAAPFAIVADAVSFFASGGLISLIRNREPKPERRRTESGAQTSLRQEIGEGLRYVAGNRYLRMIAGSTATSNFGSSILFSIFPIYVYVELGLQVGLVGVALGLGSLGLLVGATTAGRLTKRFGLGPMIVAAMFIGGPSFILVGLMPPDALVAGVLLFASQFLGGLSSIVYNVGQVSFRQAITPPEMQGRMNATMRFVVWGVMPLGSLTGGILASFLPLRTTVLIGAAISSTAFLWVLLSPVRSLREIPTGAAASEAAR
jgi:MFS family permease